MKFEIEIRRPLDMDAILLTARDFENKLIFERAIHGLELRLVRGKPEFLDEVFFKPVMDHIVGQVLGLEEILETWKSAAEG